MLQPRFNPAPMALAIALALASQGFVTTALAQPAGTAISIALPAQSLGSALNELARQARLQLMVHPDLVAGKTAPAVAGKLTVQQALDRLLSGSGLVADTQGADVIVRRAPAVSSAPAAEGHALPEVVVSERATKEDPRGPVRGLIAKRSATASKTDTALLETPQSISVVSREQMDAHGVATVEESLRYTAGVTVPYGFESRYDWNQLRGFDALNATFRDGLQQPSSGFGVPKVDAYALERVEVLRGPASVLYGGGDAGGIISLVSKKPTAETQRELRLRVGDPRVLEAAVDLGGAMNEDQTLLYRLVALSNNTRTQIERTGSTRQMLAPSLTWKPSAATELTLLAFYQNDSGIYGSDSHASPYALRYLRPMGLLQDIPSGLNTGDPGYDHFKREYTAIGYQLSHAVNDTWTLRQNLRYDNLGTDYRYLLLKGFYPANAQVIMRTAEFKDEEMRGLAVDNQAEARFNTGGIGHQLLLGLDYRRTVANENSLMSAPGDFYLLDSVAPTYNQAITVATPDSNLVERTRQLGVYAQDQLSLGQHWRVTLGGRHDWSHLDNDYAYSSIGAQSSHPRDKAFSGRAGVVYLTDFGLAPYASYNTSFKPMTGVDAAGQSFKPEKGKQYEVGVKFEPKGSKASVRAALFNIVKSDYVITDYSVDPSGVRRQVGEVESRGLEVESQLVLMRGLQFTAQYSFTDANITKSTVADDIGQLSRTPRHTAAAWLDYTQLSGPATGLGAGVGVRYVSSSIYRDTNTLAPYNFYLAQLNAPLMGNRVEIRSAGYTLTDLSVHYRVKEVKLALNVSNLFDRRYDGGCTEAICYYGFGRTMTATMTTSF